nr:MAG TPA: hypothetical protein [Caudoviricetes sp.]
MVLAVHPAIKTFPDIHNMPFNSLLVIDFPINSGLIM